MCCKLDQIRTVLVSHGICRYEICEISLMNRLSEADQRPDKFCQFLTRPFSSDQGLNNRNQFASLICQFLRKHFCNLEILRSKFHRSIQYLKLVTLQLHTLPTLRQTCADGVCSMSSTKCCRISTHSFTYSWIFAWKRCEQSETVTFVICQFFITFVICRFLSKHRLL